MPAVDLGPHQAPVLVVWGPHQAPGLVVWLPVAQVQAHEPAVALVLVVTGLVLLPALAVAGVTGSTNVAGYKQSPPRLNAKATSKHS